VGAGRVATALGVLWARAGHRIVAASGREPSRERVSKYLPGTGFDHDPVRVAHRADTVVLGVRDDLIETICDRVASGGGLQAGARVLHLSGSAPLTVLDAAREAGADVLSLHPLLSFPDVSTGIERLPGSGIAVTAEMADVEVFGQDLARDAGARPFVLPDVVKPLYHAGAVFAANYLVAVEALAEQILTAAGVAGASSLLEPLARSAFDRTFALGPEAALTGPAARGDTGTIERNLRALADAAPGAVASYVALADAVTAIALDAGRIDADQHARVREALDPWR
jgi:predicted short-subunit dehydrogenase-like oxidoreductase (DUF2520 family)